MEGDKKLPATKWWLQRLIAQAQKMGIGKRELLDDYYLEEFMIICEEWSILHGAELAEDFVTDDPAAFFNA